MNYCKIINSSNAKFSGTFETLKRSFISAFLIFMTVPLKILQVHRKVPVLKSVFKKVTG